MLIVKRAAPKWQNEVVSDLNHLSNNSLVDFLHDANLLENLTFGGPMTLVQHLFVVD